MSSSCLTLHDCCLSSTYELSYIIYPLDKYQSKTATCFPISSTIPSFCFSHLIKYVPVAFNFHSSRAIYEIISSTESSYLAALLNTNSKLSYWVFLSPPRPISVLCGSTISSFTRWLAKSVLFTFKRGKSEKPFCQFKEKKKKKNHFSRQL